MEKFIPYEKMTKKQKKEFDRQSRTVWSRSPVTKCKPSAKVYSRQKFKRGVANQEN